MWENAWVFLARRCCVCKEISEALCDVLCDGCVAKLEPARYLERAAEFELGYRALFAYTKASSRVVLTLKYQRDLKLVRWLAPQMAEQVAEVVKAEIRQTEKLVSDGAEAGQKAEAGQRAEAICVTWIPAATKNKRRRGYDQAELLARAMARAAGLPCRKLLKRNNDLPQGDRDLKGRLQGPSLVPARSLQTGKSACSASLPKSVFIVDDVVTTGSSFRRAAETLREAGVCRIGAIAVASRAKVSN